MFEKKVGKRKLVISGYPGSNWLILPRDGTHYFGIFDIVEIWIRLFVFNGYQLLGLFNAKTIIEEK